MKDYNYETDIITTPDPLFYPGDRVNVDDNEGSCALIVESCSWNTLAKSWMYTLVYFITEGDGYHKKWNGSLAAEEVLEKSLKLVSRKKFAK